MASAFSSNVDPFHRSAASLFNVRALRSRCSFRKSETIFRRAGTGTPRTGTGEPKYDCAFGAVGRVAAFSFRTRSRRSALAFGDNAGETAGTLEDGCVATPA